MSTCPIRDYPHAPEIRPKPLPPFSAQYREGLPSEWMAAKLEETDMNYEHYEDYLDKVDADLNLYMRNAVTDRNLEQPFAEEDIPNYNATKNSGALNARYNEGRGTTDYKPSHPELFMGDLQASKETVDIKMSKLKRHTATRADLAQVAMGNDTDFQIWEQAWATPDISYALKDAQRWAANNLDIWQWPSFINNSYSSADYVIRDDETRRARRDCAWKDYTDTVDDDQQFYDTDGKCKKQVIGYNIRGGDDQDHQGVKFQEEHRSKFMSSKKPTDMSKANFSVDVDMTDHSNMNKVFKGQLAHAMQSAARSQDQTQDMKKSVSRLNRKGERMYDPHSVIRDIAKTQKEQSEVLTKSRAGVHPTVDQGYHHRHTESILPWFLELNKVNMVKASRGEMDASKAQRNITQSYLLSMEVANKMKAGSCLRDDQDRQAIMREIEHQHKTGCETKSMCRPDTMAGRGMTQKRTEHHTQGQDFGNDYHTRVLSSQKLPDVVRSRTADADFDDNTFTDFSDKAGWNR